MTAEQAGIAPAATAAVEDELAGKRRRSDARLDLKRRLVFLGAHHVITVPLPAEAGGVGITGQPWNAARDRVACLTGRAVDRLGRLADGLQICPGIVGTTEARAVRDS